MHLLLLNVYILIVSKCHYALDYGNSTKIICSQFGSIIVSIEENREI